MAGLLLVHSIFMFILGRVTTVARALLDQIKGVHDYINAAELERLRIAGAPEMSVTHFARILPYAMRWG